MKNSYWNMTEATQEHNGKMKTKFYLNGRKTTRKALKETIGEERLNRMIEEAKATYREDPLTANDFFLGRLGTLSIEFDF